jgi:hypothetical protein
MPRPIIPESYGHAHYNQLLVIASRLKVTGQIAVNWDQSLAADTISVATALEEICMRHKKRLIQQGIKEKVPRSRSKKKV